MNQESPKNIQSLQRAINILNCFNANSTSLSVKEISNRLNLNINTTRGLINTLVNNNLLVHDPITNTYSLGLFFLSKANLIQKQTEQFVQYAKKFAKDIAETYNVLCSLQVVNNTDVFSVYSAHSTKAKYHINIIKYEALPIYATSSGKLVLYYNMYQHNSNCLDSLDLTSYTPKTLDTVEKLQKEMANIEKSGCSYEIEEFDLDVAGMAVPIVDSMSNLHYTLSITTFSNHFKSIKKELTKDLLKISKKMSLDFFA